MRRLERYQKLPLACRAGCALLAMALFVLAVYPYGDRYYPEGNWIAGPLWLFKTRGSTDKAIAAIASALLLPAIACPLIWQRGVALGVALGGLAVWIGFGAWLAMLAVV